MDYIADVYTRTDGYPRPLGKTMGIDELSLADILLSRGSSNISNAIVAADGGSYSHAALWTGTSVIEATLDGMTEHPFSGDRDVYRHRSPDLPSLAADVIRVARAQLGKPYAYHELLMLGALFTLGIRPERPALNVVLGAIGGTAASRLEDWIQRHLAGRAPRICTELVAVSFFRVGGGRLALQITPRSQRPAACSIGTMSSATRHLDCDVGSTLDVALSRGIATFEAARELAELREACIRLLGPSLNEPAWDAVAQQQNVLWESLAVGADTGTRLGVISPADMQFSPSLDFIGQVTESPAN